MTKAKDFKIKIPKNQKLWVTHRDTDGVPHHIITNNLDRSSYFLYKIKQDVSLEKVSSSKIPVFKELTLHNKEDKES